MPDLRRVREVADAVARNPVHVLLGLVFVVMVVVQQLPVLRQRRRYRRLAKRLGLTGGDVLSSAFRDRGMTTSELTVVSVRPGAWPEVVREITDRAARAGYQLRKPLPQSGPPPHALLYWSPRSGRLPNLVLSVYESGEAIARTSYLVPAGGTGLRGSLA